MSDIGKTKQGRDNRSNARTTSEVRWEKVVYRLFECAVQDLAWDGPIAAVKGAIRARDWKLVLRLTKANPPQTYADAASYYAACQVEHIFKKLPVPGSDDELARAAFDTFLADEMKNRRTNQRFRALRLRGYQHKNPLYTRLLRRMRFFVMRCLGQNPDLSGVYDLCDWGPGASVGVGGDNTHPYAKLDRLTVGPAALPYALGAYWHNHHIRRMLTSHHEGAATNGSHEFREGFMEMAEIVDYNKLDFVPKNATTHRTTASEPVASGYVQLGVGTMMAKRLRAFRPFIDIWSQDRNAFLAEEASHVAAVRPQATIDLKSSSQSLVTEMVRAVFFLCPGWFDIMNRTRSPSWICPRFEGAGRYELFVSMGNGFCFPLQTLIYCAAVEAVYEECGVNPYYAVYGDDIIVDQGVALLLIEWLKFLGVRTNVDKTFVFGPFRESCGADFFDGQNVRPFVLDFIPRRARDLVKIANGIRTRSARPLTRCWWAMWELLPTYARKTVRPFEGPDDTGLTVSAEFYELHRLDEYDRDLQRYKIRAFRTTSVPDRAPYGSKQHPWGQTLVALRGATPESRTRVNYGREAPVTCVEGEPLASLRRKTKERLVTL